jgi:hypothetical protein
MAGGEGFQVADLDLLTLAYIFGASFVCSIFSGLSAVGGGLLLTVFLAPIVGVKAVIPIISVYALFSNTSRVFVYRRWLTWRKIWPLMIPMVPALVIGAKIYIELDARVIAVILACVLFVSVPGRRLMHRRQIEVGPKGMAVAGAVFGLYSGAAIGGGLILIPVLMGAGFFGQAVVAIDAMIGIVVNVTRVAMFGFHDLMNVNYALAGALAGIAAFPASMIARWLLNRTSLRVHTVAMEVLLIGAGFYFLWKAYAG